MDSLSGHDDGINIGAFCPLRTGLQLSDSLHQCVHSQIVLPNSPLSGWIAGSGKTLAFLLPVVASLHQQRYEQHLQEQLQQQEATQEPTGTSAAGSQPRSNAQNANTSIAQLSAKHMKKSAAEAADRIRSVAEGTSGTAKGGSKAPKGSSISAAGSCEAAKGTPQAVKGPGAVILAPSRELAAQTARCLLLLLKGLKLRCTLLTASVAAGTDFSKVNSKPAVKLSHRHIAAGPWP